MTTDRELRRLARETADNAQAQVTQLEQEVLDLETRLTEKKAERDAARLAPKRLADFKVKIGPDYQCPQCWITGGIQSPLRPRPGTSDADVFRCPRCAETFFIPF